jgi:hypothetical protein
MLLEQQSLEVIWSVTLGLDPESKVETLSTCKRSAVETFFSVKTTRASLATIRGCALDSGSGPGVTNRGNSCR